MAELKPIDHEKLAEYLRSAGKKERPSGFKDIITYSGKLTELFQANPDLTSKDERHEIYTYIKDFLKAYDEDFDGKPENGVTGEKLNGLNTIGDALTRKLGLLVTDPKNLVFIKMAMTLSGAVSDAKRQLNENAVLKDIEKDIETTENLSGKAEELAKKGKLAEESAGLMKQLSENAGAIVNFGSIRPVERQKAVRNIIDMMNFYSDKLSDTEKRNTLRDQELADEFTHMADDLLQQDQNMLIAVKRTGKNADTGITEIITRTDEIIKNEIENISHIVEANNKAYQEEQEKELLEKKKEEQRQKDLALMKEQGLDTLDQLGLFRLRSEAPEQYAQVPFIDAVNAVLGIDGDAFPEEAVTYKRDDGTEKTCELRKTVAALKEAGIDAVKQFSGLFSPDRENGTLLSFQEISENGDRLSAFKKKCSLLTEVLGKTGKATGNVKKVLENASEDISSVEAMFGNAAEYISSYADAQELEEDLFFTIYEMQGRQDPSTEGGLAEVAAVIIKAGESAGRKRSEGRNQKKERQQPKDAAAASAQASKPLKRLTEELIPELFSCSERHEGMKGVTEQQAKELFSAYRDIYIALDACYSEGEENTSDKELFESISKVHAIAQEKLVILGCLTGEKGIGLLDEVKKYKEKSDKEREKDEDAPLYERMISCTKHLKQDSLLPQYLFSDPESPRAESLMKLMNNKAVIDAAGEFEDKLTSIAWENGKRCLDSVKGSGMLGGRTGSGESIWQYAPQNDHELFMKVVEAVLESAPEELKKTLELETSDGKKNKVNPVSVIRKFAEGLIDAKNKDGGDIRKAFTPAADSRESGGFLEAFSGYSKKFINKKIPALTALIDRLDRSMMNAGFVEGTALEGAPDGYNEGSARSFASALAPAGLLPRYRMFDACRLPLPGGRGSEEGTYPVRIGTAEPDSSTDMTVHKADDRRTFYITAENIHDCELAGELPVMINKYKESDFKGLSTDQIKDRLEDDSRREDNKRTQQREAERFTPKTNIFRDYSYYDNPGCIKGAADIQVMDILMDLPKRRPEELRITLDMIKNADGKYVAEITGIGGTASGILPFLPTEEGAERTDKVRTEDILIVSEDMAARVKKWADGQFTHEEKKYFAQLPEECSIAFSARAAALNKEIESSVAEAKFDASLFEDVRSDEGRLYEGGFTVIPGMIRVVRNEEFVNIHIDDLALGRKQAGYSGRDDAEPVNIFDSLAALPMIFHEGMKEKCFPERKGKGVAVNIAKWKREALDEQFCCLELIRLAKRTRTLATAAMKMDRDRTKERWWSRSLKNDTDEYTGVCETVKRITDTIDNKLSLISDETDHFKNGKKLGKERLAEVTAERKERLAYSQRKAKDKGEEAPIALPDVRRDPNAYFRIPEMLGELCLNIERYLWANNRPKTDLGRRRQNHMADIYNSAAELISGYSFLTGTAPIVSDRCHINDDFSVEFENENEE
ncbi:MAG: hypothetical protein J5501_06255 [Ruminococcus sp.]|nr:hypothetical protein [Ruminococcus sp.]